MPGIGFLVVTSGRPRQLAHCLESVLPLGLPVGVVVDGSDPETAAVLENCAGRFPGLRVLNFRKHTGKSRARNEGMALMNTDYVYCIDDDVTVPAASVAVLREMITDYPDLAAAGGPNLNAPGGSRFQRVSGYLLASPFVAGAMARRYAPRGLRDYCDDRSITLCNMAVRRSLFTEQGFRFDEGLCYNEENLLLQQMRRRGHRFLYHPGMTVSHERRRSLPAFLLQVAQSGRGRAMMTCMMPASLSTSVYLLPPLALALAAMTLAAAPSVFVVGAAVYGFISAASAAVIARNKREGPVAFILLAVMPALLHAAYGAGFFAGLANRLAAMWSRKAANAPAAARIPR